MHYFGTWNDAWGALEEFEQRYPELASKVPSIPSRPTSSKGKSSPGKDDKRPARQRKQKPKKPHKDFPLFPHSCGQWAKKVKGKTKYFGPWEDANQALQNWMDRKDDLLAGRRPQKDHVESLTLGELGNRFLNARQVDVAQGRLAERTWEDYKVIFDRVVAFFGKGRTVESLGPEDFQRLRDHFGETHGPKTLEGDITRTRVILNWAKDMELVDKIRYGKGFNKPSRRELRKAQAETGRKMFEPDQIQAMLEIASRSMRAMILLGTNCGFITRDCAMLPFDRLDLENGWHTFPRTKTKVERRCPLWPETIQALQEYIVGRPKPKNLEQNGLVFISQRKEPFYSHTKTNPVSRRMREIMRKTGINVPGLNFGSLRHTFETVAGDTLDQIGVDYIMGHAPRSDDMADHYRRRMYDWRLRRITDYVRDWLFSNTPRTQAVDPGVIGLPDPRQFQDSAVSQPGSNGGV